MLGNVESVWSLTHLETPEGGGEKLLLEFLGVYQDESRSFSVGQFLPGCVPDGNVPATSGRTSRLRRRIEEKEVGVWEDER